MADPATPSGQPQQLTLQQRVIQWARGQVGKTTGRGECSDLPDGALGASGGKTLSDLGESDDQTSDADHAYRWGDPIDLKDAVPGDIIQFTSHKVTLNTTVTAVFADGLVMDNAPGTDLDTQERGHHSAIVDTPLRSDGSMGTLDQHVKPLGKVVQRKTLYTRDTTTKKIEKKFVFNPKTRKDEVATVTTIVDITVTGTAQAYRARAK